MNSATKVDIQAITEKVKREAGMIQKSEEFASQGGEIYLPQPATPKNNFPAE